MKIRNIQSQHAPEMPDASSAGQVRIDEKVKGLIDTYAPAILLDDIIAPRERDVLRILLGILLAVGILLIVLGIGGAKIEGVFFLLASAWISLLLLEFFYNSYYFIGNGMDYHMAYLFSGAANSNDITKLFLSSDTGKWVFFRCGIGQSSLSSFLSSRTDTYALSDLFARTEAWPSITDSSPLTLWQYLSALLEVDQGLRQLVGSSGNTVSEVVDVARWFQRRQDKISTSDHWWSRDSLSHISGIAKDWSYGKTFFLDRFSQDMRAHPEADDIEADSEEAAADELALERVLARGHEDNPFIVGDPNESLDILHLLARKIREGTVLPEIKHCRPMLLDGAALIDSSKDKVVFEGNFVKLMDEAVAARNIILVIGHVTELIQNADRIGVNMIELLAPYLLADHIRILCFCDAPSFHQSIEPKASFVEHFDKLILKDVSEEALVHLIEREIEQYEARGKFFFTYGAIKELAQSVDRYFGGDFNPNKVRNLLSEITVRIEQTGKPVVMKSDVLGLVEEKTGIPLGTIDPDESEKLLNLESLLHERVINQDEAVVAISNAMRRARSGVNNPNRPIGSFLFLGPTGVGKTETAKALAQVFFGDERHILRLDMSEYSSADALTRLIGSFDAGKPGTLVQMLRDKQYGVLLLDEFEKASRQVHDLFLQVLDEGFFSDMQGRRVMARNLIVIATSNAGGDLIFKMASDPSRKIDPEGKRAEIIAAIVSQGIFHAEMINRFDGVVLFRPLNATDLEKVSRLMLAKLAKRLEAKGIIFTPAPDLITYLVSIGSDEKFGARSINRVIQENIEERVAEMIISGKIRSGDTFSLSAQDLKA